MRSPLCLSLSPQIETRRRGEKRNNPRFEESDAASREEEERNKGVATWRGRGFSTVWSDKCYSWLRSLTCGPVRCFARVGTHYQWRAKRGHVERWTVGQSGGGGEEDFAAWKDVQSCSICWSPLSTEEWDCPVFCNTILLCPGDRF